MFAILTRIRSWFERLLGQDLEPLKEGFLSCDSAQKQGLVMTKFELEVRPRRIMGVLPVFGVRKVGSVSFFDAVKAPIRSSLASLSHELRQVPRRVHDAAEKGLKIGTEKAVDQAKAKLNVETQKLLQKFDESHLSGLIKSDRNVFRQKLLEALSDQASQVFATATKKHLAELVLRIRQETSVSDSSSVSDDNVASLPLPTGTRFVFRKGKMTTFVIEQPPQKRTLKIMNEGGDRSEMVQLALPYVVFFIVLRGRRSDKAYVLFRKAPLRSVRDELLCPALPNIFGDFSVCFAPSAARDTLAEMAEESIASFWGGRFIKTEVVTEAHRRTPIEDWAEGSRKDSLFGISHPWMSAKQSVASMMEKISAEFVADTIAGQKKEKGGKEIASALDAAVTALATKIENEMKETCFKLVPSWNLDPTVLAQTSAGFKQSVAEVCTVIKAQLGEKIEGTLSNEALEGALEAAIQQTIASMNADMDKPMAAAREAFSAILKEKEAK